MHRKTILSLVIFLLLVKSAFAATLIINPSMDTYVSYFLEGGSPTYHSAESVLSVSRSYNVALAKFDIASYLPANTTINSATLAFRINSYGYTNTVPTVYPGATFHSINNSWLDSTVVWWDIYYRSGTVYGGIVNNFFDSTVLYSYDHNIAPTNTWVSFDATSLAQNWLTNVNNGMLIAPFWNRGGTNLSFASSEDLRSSYSVYPDNNTRQPKLIIDYVEGGEVPEPATMLLLGFGILGFAGVTRKKK